MSLATARSRKGIFLAVCSMIIAVAWTPDDPLQTWIARNAVAIRSIDAADEDFRDLEPLIEAIGSARVVQLGEPSHGAGSGFAAKVRLIKFLHQRMGFDVVAWESGLYDVTLTQAGLRAGEDPVLAAKRGIFTIWSNAQEVRPLFDYAKASQASARPLDMAGFDIQVTAKGSTERFAVDLRSFVRALPDSTLRHRTYQLADQALAARDRIYALKKPEDVDSLFQAARDLLALIRRDRQVFEQVHGTREISFMERAVENMWVAGVNVYDSQRSDRPTGAAGNALHNEGWNRRDSLSAHNLRWLIQEGFPGRKIIVWAHNSHIMNAYFAADMSNISLHLEPQPGGLKPSGVFLADWLKDEVYTIALTTYEGEDGWANGQRGGPIAPAAAGSLESRLHQLGVPYLFLDLRALDDSIGHPMRTPQSMRINFYRGDTLPDLTRAFDAVLYVDRMAPATPPSAP